MSEIISDRATRYRHTHVGGKAVGWREAIGKVAKADVIRAFELDAEIRSAAVVLRIKTIRLAASSGSNLDDLHIDTL